MPTDEERYEGIRDRDWVSGEDAVGAFWTIIFVPLYWLVFVPLRWLWRMGRNRV